MACEPDIIFIRGHLAASYDALSEIAPVVYRSTDVELGMVESLHVNATTIASIFGLENRITEKLDGFSTRISALSAVAEGKTTIVGTTSGGFNILGHDGRCSIIGVEVGFDNLGDGDVTSTYGAQPAKEIGENELVVGTDAFKNGNIVYLAHPAVWYTAEGGISAFDIMFSDIEGCLLTW